MLQHALGILGGWVLWLSIHRAPDRRSCALLLCVAGLTYLIDALAPYGLASEPKAMHWLPFSSSLETGIQRVLPAVAFACLCYGAMIWSAARMGASVAVSAVLVAMLALACEAVQQYLPGRTAEVSFALTALAMGWLVAVLAPARAQGSQTSPYQDTCAAGRGPPTAVEAGWHTVR